SRDWSSDVCSSDLCRGRFDVRFAKEAIHLMTHMANQAQSIPLDLAQRKAANKNLKFIIGGLLVIALVIVLIVQATMSTGAYYLTVTELDAKGTAMVGERVRVSGAVVDRSEERRVGKEWRCAE